MNLDKNQIFLECEHIRPTHFHIMIDFTFQDSYKQNVSYRCHGLLDNTNSQKYC